MGPLPVVLIDERVSERHPTGMILRESDCGQRSHQHPAFVRGCRRALRRNLGCGGTSFESGRTDLVECRMSATSCVDEIDSPIHFVLAFNMDTNIVSICGFRKHSIFDRRPRTGGNRTLRESLHVGNSRR